MATNRIGFESEGFSASVFASHFAPASIHWRNVAMSFSESCFFGGMCGSESGRMTFASKLLSALRGTSTGPLSLPLRAFSRDVNRRPPFFFSSLWQERQFTRRIDMARAGEPSAFVEADGFSAARELGNEH